MTTLKDINFGLNQYCGPAVLSALTGKSTDECAAVISSISGKREIKAVDVQHLVKAFEKLRFMVTKEEVYSGRLFGTLSNLVCNGDALYIIVVPKHVVAVEIKDGKVYLVDNHSKSPLPAEGSARLMQTVESIYKIVERAKPLFLSNEIILEKSYSGAIFHVEIKSHNKYMDRNDDTMVKLGEFYYKDNLELKWIIDKLQELIR